MHVQESEPGIYSIWFGDSRLMEGRASGAMQRHAWAYPLLYELAAYQRPAHLISPLSNESNKDKALAFQAASAQVTPSIRQDLPPCGNLAPRGMGQSQCQSVDTAVCCITTLVLSTVWPSLLHRC